MNLKLLDHFHHKKRENHLLCIVIALAVTLHFLAIYLLHGMHIHGEMFTARPISQQNSFPFSSHNSEDKRIEREIRNQQLANAFEKSKIQPPQQPEFSPLH